jgi:hypothetical protein
MTSVVACQHKPPISVAELPQPGEVRYSTANILLDVEAVSNSVRNRRIRHQLHQSHSTG